MQRSNQDPAGQALQLAATGGSHNRSTGIWGLSGSRGRPQSVHSSHRYGPPGQGMLHPSYHVQVAPSCDHPHKAFQICIVHTMSKLHFLAIILIKLFRSASGHAQQSTAVHYQTTMTGAKTTFVSDSCGVPQPQLPITSALWLNVHASSLSCFQHFFSSLAFLAPNYFKL